MTDVTTATVLYKHLDPYFQTDYAAQRIPTAFGRAYVAVPDRRPEIVRFLSGNNATIEEGVGPTHRIPCGIQPPTTAPTVIPGIPGWGQNFWAHVKLTVGGVFDANSVLGVTIVVAQTTTNPANYTTLGPVEINAGAVGAVDVDTYAYAFYLALLAEAALHSTADLWFEIHGPNIWCHGSWGTRFISAAVTATGGYTFTSEVYETDMKLANGRNLDVDIVLDGTGSNGGGTIAFTINENDAEIGDPRGDSSFVRVFYDKYAVNATFGNGDTAAVIAAEIVAAIQGATSPYPYADFSYEVSASDGTINIKAKQQSGAIQQPFDISTVAFTEGAGIKVNTSATSPVTLEANSLASGMVIGNKVRFAYQYYAPSRGVWSDLSPWSKLYEVGTWTHGLKFMVEGFEAPREGVNSVGFHNSFGIDQIWLYAAFETIGGYCDVGSMVIDRSHAGFEALWSSRVVFDMSEDMLVRATPEPLQFIHSIPPAVAVVEPFMNRLFFGGQLRKRTAPPDFPARTQVVDANGDPCWPSGTTIFIEGGSRYRIDEDDLTMARAKCTMAGCWIDESYLGYDLYIENRRVGMVFDIARSTTPVAAAQLPYEHTYPYSCVFYLDVDWSGMDYTAAPTGDFYFAGHPRRPWLTGWDAEQSPTGELTLRPETIHPLHYLPDLDDDIVDARNAGELLYIFCKHSVWIVGGKDSPGTPAFSVRKIDDVIGEIAPRSTVMLPNKTVQFTSQDGVFRVNTGGIQPVSGTLRRMFMGRDAEEGITNASRALIKSALVRNKDFLSIIMGGFTRGAHGTARQGWMTQNLGDNSVFEHDNVEITSNILGDDVGVFPPLCGDGLGRIKTLLNSTISTDLHKTSASTTALASETAGTYVCRYQSGIYAFDGARHTLTRLRLILKE